MHKFRPVWRTVAGCRRPLRSLEAHKTPLGPNVCLQLRFQHTPVAKSEQMRKEQDALEEHQERLEKDKQKLEERKEDSSVAPSEETVLKEAKDVAQEGAKEEKVVSKEVDQALKALQADAKLAADKAAEHADPSSPEHQKKKDEENAEKAEIHDTGVIETTEKERLLYFDNIIFPTPSFLLGDHFFPTWLLTRSEARVKDVIRKYAIPPGLHVSFNSVILRPKDGGAFVRYTMREHNGKYHTPREAEAAIILQLKKSDYRPWFDPFRTCRVFTVKGVPWIEDLKRIPNKTLKVWFEGPTLSQEELYSLFRRYGYIDNIIPPDPASKDPLVFAKIIYSCKGSATTAKNCLNGMSVNDKTIMHITFAEHQTWLAFVKDFIVTHTRISIPLLLALLATVSLWIFDPIRKESIKSKIQPIINLENNIFYVQTKRILQPIWNWLWSWVVIHPRSSARRGGTQLHQLWPERLNAIDDVKQWLQENVNTFIVVNGPRGSGKQELVMDYVLADRRRDGRGKVLQIDCADLAKARNDPEFITTAAHQLGYFPVFPWMNNISSFIDLAIQGLTGQKGGFSETTEAQFKSMLGIASAAIADVALANHSKEDHAKNQITRNSDYLQSHPDAKPVIVIEHFLARTDRNQFIYKHLAEWAASLIQSNTAHVIFITSDVTFQKVLSAALPNQIFKTVHAGDASAQSARDFVKQQMDEFKQAIEAARHLVEENQEQRKRVEKLVDEEPSIDEMLQRHRSELEYEREKREREGKIDDTLDEIIKEEKVIEERDRAEWDATEASERKDEAVSPFDPDENTEAANAEAAMDKEDNPTVDADEEADKKSKKDTAADNITAWKALIPPGTDEVTLAETPIPELTDLDESLNPLGGRMTDLQAFIRRLKSGDTPREALRGMITQSATEIVQMFLMKDSSLWTKEQVWCLMKKVSKDNGVGVSIADLMVTEPLFKGALKPQGESGESTIGALERSEMVTVVTRDGKPTYIKAGKPLYRAAFQYILSDKTFSAMVESGFLESQMKIQSDKIVKYEEELRLLAKFPSKWGDDVNIRVRYLIDKMAACQQKLEKFEMQLAETKKTFAKKEEPKSWWKW
ncbi:Mitochondrial escape protein 2 [Yarrowia sp. B02]|nr:Mitochondrial escape protein 2 [Yarrowia sp. B02]